MLELRGSHNIRDEGRVSCLHSTHFLVRMTENELCVELNLGRNKDNDDNDEGELEFPA